MNLIFDTETSGRAAFDRPPEYEGQPHLVQLACIMADDGGGIQAEVSIIVAPDGWIISEEVARIHGISQARAEAGGLPRRLALSLFNMMLSKSQRVIAHNLDFDKLIMLAQFAREGATCRIGDVTHICTMKVATPVVRLPARYTKRGDPFKWPSLTELHQHLFGEGFSGAHDAMVDTRALCRCYFELVRLGHVKLR